MAHYPIEICSNTLATVLEDLSTETLARTDAVAWAQDLLDAHGTVHPGCYSFGREHNDFCWTWQIVFGANYHERGHVSDTPPPYFYRLSDFAEWADRTRNVDPPSSGASIFPVRPHQCPRTFADVPAFGIARSFDAFRERLGVTSDPSMVLICSMNTCLDRRLAPNTCFNHTSVHGSSPITWRAFP